MNILALMAHPDDAEISCGGTLLKYAAQGHKVFIALATSGNTGSNVIPSKYETARVREAEQLEAAKGYGAEVMFLRFEDEGLFDTPETRSAVLTALRWAAPDVVITHDPKDMSTDHNMTAKLVTEVLLSIGGKQHSAALPPVDKAPSVFFTGAAGDVGTPPQAYVDISEYETEKLKLFEKHASQFAWLGEFHAEDLLERVSTMDRLHGMQCGCRYAEGFTAHRILGYAADYRLLP